MTRWFAVWMASVSALGGCAGSHEAALATEDLACAPPELRSAWWSEGGGPFYGGAGAIVVSPAGTHLLMEDHFRSISVRLSDGAQSDGSRPTVELTDVAGVRFAAPRMVVDADGRNDYAGMTDVWRIGTAAPIAEIPWIVPRDAGGYTQVVAHVSQSSDRAFLVERSIRFGEPDRGVWLRVIPLSAPREEVRIDLRTVLAGDAVTFESPFSILVDEARDVVFVTVGRQVESPPSITRIALATGAAFTVDLEIGETVPFVGLAHIGDPATQLLDASLSSDGSELLVTTRDGRLRALDASTLLESRALGVGVVVANEDTYLPSLRSPVAASSEDRYLALLDDAGHVTIVDAATMAPLATLVSAAPIGPHDTEHDGEARAMMVRFVAGGLIVVTDRGVERYRCPDGP